MDSKQEQLNAFIAHLYKSIDDVNFDHEDGFRLMSFIRNVETILKIYQVVETRDFMALSTKIENELYRLSCKPDYIDRL